MQVFVVTGYFSYYEHNDTERQLGVFSSEQKAKEACEAVIKRHANDHPYGYGSFSFADVSSFELDELV